VALACSSRYPHGLRDPNRSQNNVLEADSGGWLARDRGRGGSFGRSSVPPSLVSSQLCVFAQENSAIHKEKYLWKLKLRVSIANDRGKGSTSCFGNYNYVCLPSQRQRKGYNTSLFSRRLSQAPPPRLSAPTNGMRALPALPYALMFFPCIGDAKRYGAVAFRRGDAIPCVLPPALAPNHHHPPALP
jgi:hypothetical protein